MSITVDWANEDKSVVTLKFVGQWTWDDLSAALGKVADLTQSVTQRVDLIVDTRDGVQLKDQGGLMHLRQVVGDRRRPANGGLTVVVGSNLYFQRLMQALLKVYSKITRQMPFAFADTMDDAWKVINSVRKEATI